MSASGILHAFGAAVAMLAIMAIAAWGALALWFKWSTRRASTVACMLAWLIFCTVVLAALWRGQMLLALCMMTLGCGAFAWWWLQLEPSNDRAWNDDVARLLTGAVAGDTVMLTNLRDFEWRSRVDYTARWQTRSCDLRRLRSLDLVLSYWAGPAIAHTLVSFGFDDGEHVVFSVEVRRWKGAVFSEIGGFFKVYELSIVAATERDAIRVRTNVRGEDDYLYRVRMQPGEMRQLFLAYVEAANRLVDTPRFYNTVTANCTTIIYHMVSHIVGRLPLSWRLLLSGYLPEYLYALGALDTRYPLGELRARGRLRERAQAADQSAAFSAEIRRGIAELPEPVPQR